MKIGIDIRPLMDARYSGVSEYALNLIKRILKSDKNNEYRLFYNCFGQCPNIPEFAGENVKIVKYGYPNKILNYLFFKFFNYPKIDKELEADVFFMPHINFIGMSSRAKSLITVHDLSFLRYPEFFSRRKNFWHRMINARKTLNRFNAIVAASENTKRDIVELCGVDENKVKVIYAGIGEEYKKISDADEPKMRAVKDKYKLPDKFILYLGTLEPRKNVDGIIRAYNKFRVENGGSRNVKLIIAGGKGWKSFNIHKEWIMSAFKDDIEFLGYVDGEDKPYLYNLASVFVYPSFYEGFGFPPLEAMACGTPVVASYAASLPEITGGAALMVNPHNDNDIAAVVAEILKNDSPSGELRNKLIANGLEQAAKFSWDKTAEKYLEIINTM